MAKDSTLPSGAAKPKIHSILATWPLYLKDLFGTTLKFQQQGLARNLSYRLRTTGL